MDFVPLGDCALLIRLGDSAENSDAVFRLTQQLDAVRPPPVIELVPAYTSLGVFYDATATSFDELKAQIERVLRDSPAVSASGLETRIIDMPVCYEGEFAPDLADVARHTGLTSAEVVQRHSAADYVVSCIGFTPGFPYLSGLPRELATPRRATPRKEVPAGAVGIGGSQTGIYPQSSPGGWNIIGRTPLRLFNLNQQPPALLRASDRVRFRAIPREEFDATAR